jgi:hypothetical protein
MIKELENVILTVDLPKHHLLVGDIGTVVLVHGEGEGYEVEFTTFKGETIAVVSVYPDQIRPVERHEVAHVRAGTMQSG